MFCRKCGNELPDDVQFCPKCGNPVDPAAAPAAVTVERINTWLIPAIFAAVYCCMPFGIVSVVYADGANTEVSNRNCELAREKADKAKTWFWISVGCGILMFLINAEIL